jgi:hypothetical protein
MAVKIREDDLESWALHAWLRSQLRRKITGSTPAGLKIGRRWCRSVNPGCKACPLNRVCPRFIDKASLVRVPNSTGNVHQIARHVYNWDWHRHDRCQRGFK